MTSLSESLSQVQPSLRELLKVASPAEIEYLKILVYGEPGAGKTHFIGTAMDHPMTRPLLVIDANGGMLTLRKRHDVDIKEAKTLEEAAEYHQMLLNENKGYYKTVAIDGVTELQKLDMNDIMYKLTRAPGAPRPDLDPDIPGIPQWGKTGEHMRKIVRWYRDLPMNVIMTAHVLREQDESMAVKLYPSLPGKMKTELSGFMDIVAYLHTTVKGEEVTRHMQFLGTSKLIAKDRTGALGNIMDNTSIPEIWDKIFDTEETQTNDE